MRLRPHLPSPLSPVLRLSWLATRPPRAPLLESVQLFWYKDLPVGVEVGGRGGTPQQDRRVVCRHIPDLGPLGPPSWGTAAL